MKRSRIEIERVFAVAGFLMVAGVGCAHSQNKMASSSESAAAKATVPDQDAPPPFAPKLQVDLPYGFTRRGVEITVNSVEFTDNQFEVSLMLHETRGEAAEILSSTLMEAQTDTHQVLPFAGYNRAGLKQAGPDIRLAADEHVAIDLLFQLPPNFTPGTPLLIQFRTGKWWRS